MSPTSASPVTLTTDISGCGSGNASTPSLYYLVSGPPNYNSYYSNVTLTNGGDTAQASVNLGLLPPGTYSVAAYGRGTPCFASSYNYTWTSTTYLTVTAAGPAAPTNLVATRNANGTVGLSWTASTDSTGTVTSYTVTPSPSCPSCSGLTVTGNPAATSTAVSGLTLGTTYYFTVEATDSNSAVSLASSPSNNVIPATAPGQPTGVDAIGAMSSATISWAAAAANGSSVTSYLVTASPSGATCGWTTGPLQCSISGLSNGTAYTFTVVATNGVGPGLASTATLPVTPNPTALTVTQTGTGTRGATVVGTGLLPGSTVTITLHSIVPINLATVTVGQSGSFTESVSFPASTPAGAHTVIATGTSPAGSVVSGTLAVTVANPLTVPSTGALLLAPRTVGLALLLIISGVAAVVLGIRRRFDVPRSGRC